MALVKCPDCGKMVSERAVACPECGCPIRKEVTKLIVKASKPDRNIGIFCHYKIFDENGEFVKKLQYGEVWQQEFPDATDKIVYGVKFSGGLAGPVDMVIEPNKINKYQLSQSTFANSAVVSRIDVIDCD